jgi:IS5 family transposase
VSLHDPDARPIANGRLGKPVEFGYQAQVVDNTDGIVLDHTVHRGNPADAPLLAPAIGRISSLLGRTPRAVTADRSYGEAKIDTELAELGVKTVVIPRKGKPSQARRDHEHRRGFRRLVKWRTGSEGRIAYLKRRYGLDRTLLDALPGAQTWCGLGVLTHNTVKIASLVQTRNPARRTGTSGRATPGTPSKTSTAPAADTGPPRDPPRSRSTAT